MNSEKIIKPFVQWVGGKRKIVKQLIRYIPRELNNYYEPFLGGGALFFNVRHLFKKCFLSDINQDLVTSYNSIKTSPDEVYTQLIQLNKNHTLENYYKLCKGNYTNNPIGITARFIYVNKHTFKGVFKVNKDGQIKSTCDTTRSWQGVDFAETLKTCSSQLSGTTICANDFSFIEPRAGDFVYFDPPYHKSGEIFYTRLPFDEDEQIRLKDFVLRLNDKGVKVMISNSDTKFIRDIYKNLEITEINTSYAISPKKAKEVIITNYSPSNPTN